MTKSSLPYPNIKEESHVTTEKRVEGKSPKRFKLRASVGAPKINPTNQGSRADAFNRKLQFDRCLKLEA